jgi:hypothetical protein
LFFFSSVGKKTALLVFSALAFVSAKTKCAVCAAGFSLQVTVGASVVRSFETATCQVCTEPSRLFVKHYF